MSEASRPHPRARVAYPYLRPERTTPRGRVFLRTRSLFLCFGQEFLVEVIGTYSNHSDQEERVRNLLQMVPLGHPEVNPQTRKQVQRRLRGREIDELVRNYQKGLGVYELATRYKIHRETVSLILRRQGIPRRYRLIQGEQLDQAVAAYEAGRSLAAIGAAIGVSPTTIRKALISVGTTIRPRRGWRKASA
jgi:hypothetical protein